MFHETDSELVGIIKIRIFIFETILHNKLFNKIYSDLKYVKINSRDVSRPCGHKITYCDKRKLHNESRVNKNQNL